MKSMLRLTQKLFDEVRTAEIELPRNFAPGDRFEITAKFFEQPEPTFEELFPDEYARETLLIPVRKYLADGKKIEAIKLIKAYTHWYLITAKQYVENL